MKLVYIHQHFTTNAGSGGTRSYDVSRHLAARGHDVTMVCGVLDQSGLPPVPRGRWFATHHMDGFKVVVCNAAYSNRMRVAARLLTFARFAALATIACLRERGADLIFATSTPLTVGIPARLASALLGVPYVFEVRDLWPEDLLAAGRLKPGLQYRAWAWLEEFSYAGASRVLLVSKGFHDRLLERGYRPDFLRTILLGADGTLFRRQRPDREYIRQHELEGKTIAVYTGAHGDANGLNQVLDAAERLRDRTDIAIVLLGDGGAKPALRQAAAARGLDNIRLLDPVVKTRLPDILAACHIGLMVLKQITRPRWVTPNKLFDYMFAGLPTIVNFPGTTAELVESLGAGVAVEPGSPDALADQIRRWADHPDEAAAIGRRARELAFARFDRERIAAQLEEVFADVAGDGKARPGRCVGPRRSLA